MKTIIPKICKWIGLPGAVIIISCAGLIWLIGCATSNQSSEGAAGTTGKRGAQLWADNCNRCHNIRAPSNYSAAQRGVIMMHMLIRANLAPEEQQKIPDLLKSVTVT